MTSEQTATPFHSAIGSCYLLIKLATHSQQNQFQSQYQLLPNHVRQIFAWQVSKTRWVTQNCCARVERVDLTHMH